MKKKLWWILPIAALLLLLFWVAEWWFGFLPKPRYAAKDFNIEIVKSTVDFDADGIEDYADLLAGAKKDAKNRPRYHSAYYQGGYPPEEEGVCTDLVWRAFKEAGYSLRLMVDADVRNRPQAYPNIEKADANIDFRRVTNLRIFFDAYAKPMTTDIDAIAEWQADGKYIYGEAIAADTGGAIKGNIIDICVNSNAEAYRFGRRTVNVYILDYYKKDEFSKLVFFIFHMQW